MDTIGEAETDQFNQIAESFRLLAKPSLDGPSRGSSGGYADFSHPRAQVLDATGRTLSGQPMNTGQVLVQAPGQQVFGDSNVSLVPPHPHPRQQPLLPAIQLNPVGLVNLQQHHQNGLQGRSHDQSQGQAHSHSEQKQSTRNGGPSDGLLPSLYSGPSVVQNLSHKVLSGTEAFRARDCDAKEEMEEKDSRSESLATTRSESSLSVSVDPLHDIPVTSPGPPSVGHKRERELRSILSQMPEHPLRHRAGHRRTQSEVQVRGNYPSVAENVEYGANPENMAMAELANHEDGEALLLELMGFGAGGGVAAQMGLDFGRSSGGIENITLAATAAAAAVAAARSGGGACGSSSAGSRPSVSMGVGVSVDICQAAAGAGVRLDVLPSEHSASIADPNSTSSHGASASPLASTGPSEDPRLHNQFQMGVSPHHNRSISVDENLLHSFHVGSSKEAASPGAGRRSRSQSFDEGSAGGQGNMNCEFDAEGEEAVKKVLAGKKLTELEMIDPKRAKRILANRQSAARSKERKTRYILELEEKVTFYEQESVALKATLAILQRETTSLAKVNDGMSKKMQLLEKLFRQREVENKGLQSELEILRQATGQLSSLGPFSPTALPSPSPSPQLSLEQQLLALLQPQAAHQAIPLGSQQHQQNQRQHQHSFAAPSQVTLQAQQGRLAAQLSATATTQQQQNQLLALQQVLSQQQVPTLGTMLNLHQGPFSPNGASPSILGNPYNLVKNE